MPSSSELVTASSQPTLPNDTKVKVFVRSRPLLPSEDQQESMISIDEESNILTINEGNVSLKQTFDKAYGQEVTQMLIFKDFEQPIQKVLEGYNFTIFAYGQTGSGKTYTMFGCDWENMSHGQDSPQTKRNGYGQSAQQTFFESLESDINFAGIIPRTIFSLFNSLNVQRSENPNLNINVYCSFLQVYNEKIYDLLQEKNALKPLDIHESKLDGIFVEGLSEYQVSHYYDTLELMKRGERNRATRSTSMNAKSSRSHTIFQLIVETIDSDNKDGGTIKRARINLCDLAGSEKINKQEAMVGGHFNELRNINLSLTTLGKVIHSLSSKTKLPIPFRESKLTRILQESLVGNTITFIIATISPSIQNIDETVGTLKFAERARHITMTVKPNQISSKDDENVKKLQREVLYLKEILNLRRKGQSVNDIHQKFLKLQAENEKLRKDHISIREVEKLIQENRRMKTEIQHIYMSQSMHTAQSQEDQSNKDFNRTFDNMDSALRSPNPNDIQQQQQQTDEFGLPISQKSISTSLPNHNNNNQIFNYSLPQYSDRSLTRKESPIDNSRKFKSHFFQTPPPMNLNQQPAAQSKVHKSFNSILPKYFSNNSTSTNNSNNYSLASPTSNQMSSRNEFMGSDSFTSNTPVKIRVRGRQDYQLQEGFIEITAAEAIEKEKQKKEKKRILERLDQLERIQKYNADKLQKELNVIEAIDRSTNIKKQTSSLINLNTNKPSNSIAEIQKQQLMAPLIDKQRKQLKDYEEKIKQLEKRYFSSKQYR